MNFARIMLGFYDAAEERPLLPSLIAFIATLSSAFSILLSHSILRKGGLLTELRRSPKLSQHGASKCYEYAASLVNASTALGLVLKTLLDRLNISIISYSRKNGKSYLHNVSALIPEAYRKLKPRLGNSASWVSLFILYSTL